MKVIENFRGNRTHEIYVLDVKTRKTRSFSITTKLKAEVIREKLKKAIKRETGAD